MSLTASFTKRAGDFFLQVDLKAEDEVLALFGHSGSGKSMTLRCIAGIDTPDDGFIEIDGKTVFDSRKNINVPPGKRGVGLLFQEYALFPTYTVGENIACGLPKMSRGAKKAAVTELLRRYGLEGLESHYPRQLSGGQQQRTALARMMAAKPSLILLDEPFSALDLQLRRKMEWDMASFLESFPGTAVLVSHDRGEVRRLARKVCVLEQGTAQPILPTEQLFSAPPTRAAAVLTGCENFAPVEAVEDGRVFLPSWNTWWTAEGSPMGADWIGVRGGALHPAQSDDENLLQVTVRRVFFGDDGLPAILADAPDGSPIYASWPGLSGLVPGERITLSVEKQDIYLLKG